jgi:hypothetical protein
LHFPADVFFHEKLHFQAAEQTLFRQHFSDNINDPTEYGTYRRTRSGHFLLCALI